MIKKLSKKDEDYKRGFRWVVHYEMYNHKYKTFKNAFDAYIKHNISWLYGINISDLFDKILMVACLCLCAYCVYMLNNAEEIYEGYKYGFYALISLLSATMFVNKE